MGPKHRYLADPSISAAYDGMGIIMTDIDCTIRDKNWQTKALIEFKHGNIQKVDLSQGQIAGLRSDADKLQVPLFVAVYYHLDRNKLPIESHRYKSEWGKVDTAKVREQIDHSQYFVIAGNELAKTQLQTTTVMMTEHDFFELQATLTSSQLNRTLGTTLVEVDIPAVIHQSSQATNSP